MGGLYPKMQITALTMLVGVLAIAGIPLFSGWYSKDAILAQALGFACVHPQHVAAVHPAAGDGRHHDVLHVPHVVPDVHRQAARPARLRARPRVAAGDDGAAGRPGGVQRRSSPGAGRSWDADDQSYLEHVLAPRRSRSSVTADFGRRGCTPSTTTTAAKPSAISDAGPRHCALAAGAGRHGRSARVRRADVLLPRARPGRGEASSSPASTRFLHAQVVLRRAVQRPARAAGAGRGRLVPLRSTRNVIDGTLHGIGAADGQRPRSGDGRFDNGIIDGLVNLIGHASSTPSAAGSAHGADRVPAQLRAVPGAGGGRAVRGADVLRELWRRRDDVSHRPAPVERNAQPLADAGLRRVSA